MEEKLAHHNWHALRRVVRAKGRSVAGHHLRMELSQRTKDGSFLAKLVEDGLLVVAHPDPNPLVATYKLTELGKEAAEFGVYEMDWDVLKTRR